MIEVWGVPVAATVEDIIRQLKAELTAANIPLLKDAYISGRNLMVTCIMHKGGQERRPSMGISLTETRGADGRVYPPGTVHCFRCGYVADLPTLISNCFGYNDQGMFGYRWITKRFVAVEVEQRPSLELDMNRDSKPAPVSVPPVDEAELKRYRVIHPYMKQRKLTDRVIEYFDVGYDEETDSLTFPVHDLDGRVLFVQRRKVAGKGFLNTDNVQKSQVVYGLYQVMKNLDWIDTIYITESIIDALTLWGARRPAVALMGAMPSNHQIGLLKRCPVRCMVDALDNDQAGRAGGEKLRKMLGRYKMLYRLVYPPGVKDVNEMTEEQLANLQVTLV